MAEKKETTALATTLNETQLGQIFVKSGFFADAKDESQAIVKILAGREAGLQPIESMTGIHIIKGKISFGANMMAAAVKKSGRYDYRVMKHDAKECTIDFFELIDGKKEKIGTSSFTIEEAKQIGLTANTTWKNYPKAMLFARALSAGVRYYCPDVFGHSPVYVPEELGARVDGDGEPIDITPKEPKPEKNLSDLVEEGYKNARPLNEEQLKKEGVTIREASETEVLKVIPNDPLPSTKSPRGRPKAEKSQHYDPETQDNPHESEPEAEPEQVKEATEKPPKTEDGLQITPSVIEKMKNAGTPREAFEIMEKYAFQGQGHHLKALVKQSCPEFFDRGYSIMMIPETALIAMIQKATGMKMKAVEKTHKCKSKGCKNQLTEADENTQCWECRAKEPED
jgi:hypothetical protein